MSTAFKKVLFESNSIFDVLKCVSCNKKAYIYFTSMVSVKYQCKKCKQHSIEYPYPKIINL